MKKRKRRKEQKSKRFRGYSVGEPFRNDQLSRGLNKYMGLPEDFEGDIAGFEKQLPMAVKIFGSHKVEEVPRDEKSYTPQ